MIFAKLYKGLARTRKLNHYHLVKRLLKLFLTLPVSTFSIERAFLVMKIVKKRLCNRMDDEFLGDNLLLYIEKKLQRLFCLDSILDDFIGVSEHQL